MISKEWININKSFLIFDHHLKDDQKEILSRQNCDLDWIFIESEKHKNIRLQNGVRPTERALWRFTQPRRNFTYYNMMYSQNHNPNSKRYSSQYLKSLTFWNSQNIRNMLEIEVPMALVTQPMPQLRPNRSLLRSMDYYHQIFCRFQKRKRKVPPPSLLCINFEKSWFFSKILVTFFFFR